MPKKSKSIFREESLIIQTENYNADLTGKQLYLAF